MFNVTVNGNVRCNGIVPGGMGHHVNNNAMPPNRGKTISVSDTKLKFSDRLKAYLSTDGLRSDGTEVDDPYNFSDSEVVKPVLVNNVAKKCVDIKFKVDNNSLKSKSNNVNHVETGVKSELNSGKTMSRLQAQIARNKVTVKHNRNSPDLKVDRHCFEKSTKHSIIGLVNNVCISKRSHGRKQAVRGKPVPGELRMRRASRATQHEGSLQRIPATAPIDIDTDDGQPFYQRHWFCKQLELLSREEGPREARLELTRTELRRQLFQMKQSGVGQARNNQPTSPTLNSARTFLTDAARYVTQKRNTTKNRTNTSGLLVGRICQNERCTRSALPCTKHCPEHIMSNTDQVLFDYCTAKFADNTQCSVPVFDITHELPLCIEHARKRDNYNRMCLETKPKKPRRKIKPSAMIRPQKRNKKRKRPQKNMDLPHTQTTAAANSMTDVTELSVCETSSAYESSEEITLGNLSESEFVTIKAEDHIGDHDVVEQVLAMEDEVGVGVGVGDVELLVGQTLVTQASRLLEETDFTNVLNQIPADDFNDLFTDRNGEYEPSREETEELERALEAVDEEVKSMEKLSQTQGLLDSLLDEHTLVESLVQIPDVFHNGYGGVQCVDSPASHQSSPRQVTTFHPALLGVDGMMPVHSQAHTPS